MQVKPPDNARSRTWKDYGYYAVVAFFAFVAIGQLGLLLEDPAKRAERLREQAQQEQDAVAANQQLAAQSAKQARLDACTYVETQAYVYSQPAVRASLKAPSTASFPWSSVKSKHTGNCRFEVLGYVDAQNSFGAMIQARFMAIMTYDPDTGVWTTKEVGIDDSTR